MTHANSKLVREANQLCSRAVRDDDVALMEQAVETASQSDSPQDAVRDLLQRALRRATSREAVHVLEYLLDHGANVEAVRPFDVFPVFDESSQDDDFNDKPSMKVLDMLAAKNWDVNTHGEGFPLLWQVLQYPDLVQWCLDHGARVDVPHGRPDLEKVPYNPPRFNADGTEQLTVLAPRNPVTILGQAARYASVETFELLRDRGAPLDPRTLHIAAQTGRIDMVQHLVDVVGLDVNAVVYHLGDTCTTPLCYLAGPPIGKSTHESYRDVITFLLDHGADPSQPSGIPDCPSIGSPYQCAQHFNGDGFLNAVQAWRARQQDNGAAGRRNSRTDPGRKKAQV